METNTTVLIVDDDKDDIDFFRMAMQKIDPGAVCHVANDCEEALEKLRHEYEGAVLPDYIFLDLNMPRMDGRACLKELKKDAKLRNIPVIIYTTSSHARDRDETLKLGAAYFLTKPNALGKMRQGIAEAIGRAASG